MTGRWWLDMEHHPMMDKQLEKHKVFIKPYFCFYENLLSKHRLHVSVVFKHNKTNVLLRCFWRLQNDWQLFRLRCTNMQNSSQTVRNNNVHPKHLVSNKVIFKQLYHRTGKITFFKQVQKICIRNFSWPRQISWLNLFFSYYFGKFAWIGHTLQNNLRFSRVHTSSLFFCGLTLHQLQYIQPKRLTDQGRTLNDILMRVARWMAYFDHSKLSLA